MLFWAILFYLQGPTSASAEPAKLSARLEKQIQSSSIPRSALGLVVLDLNAANPTLIFQLNDQSEMVPASVTKLATAVTALHELGPAFKFQTSLWSSGTIHDNRLDGDLVLKGGGDPGFVSETMWVLVNEFVRSNIKEVSGDLIVDDHDFDQIRNDPSRDPERVDRAYDAPVGAMSFNWNSVNIFVRPTAVGQSPQVYLDPLPTYFTIDNKAKTVAHAGSDLQISRREDSLLVRGSIGIQHDEAVVFKNIDDPADWSGHNLVSFLEQRGIHVKGKVKSGHKPETARLLAKVDSKPLSLSVLDMMKFSNNYVAEMLTKGLALHAGVTPASLEEGMKIVRTYLNAIGIESSHFTLLNPSGLSRKNRIRPRDLATILVHAQKQFPTFAEFLTALPIAGQDGTLKKRMTGADVAGWVRAKTGSLTGIVTLAGFAGRKDGSLRAFAFIFNGRAEQDDSARHLFDALATQLVQ